MARRRKPIRIKKRNRGKLRSQTKKNKNGNIKRSELLRKKRSKNPKTRKRATFALNARKWRKKGRRKSK